MPFEKSNWFGEDEPSSVPNPEVLKTGAGLQPFQKVADLHSFTPPKNDSQPPKRVVRVPKGTLTGKIGGK